MSSVVRARRLLYATTLVMTLVPQAHVGLAADCEQPSDSGCRVAMNKPVTAVIANSGDVHSWLLSLESAAPLHIVLSNLNAGYGLHVYGADGSLLGESANDGSHDDVVDLPQAGAGTYTINIDSPGGDISDQPYSLLVGAPTSAAASQPDAPGAASRFGETVPGTVLLSDDFTNEHNGSLRSGPVSNGFVKYLDGEYQMAQTQAGNPWPATQIPGTYVDSSIAFDIRFVNPAANVALIVGCRRQQGQAYFAQVRPQMRTASLFRLEGNTATNLVPPSLQSALQQDSSNHIELRCVGTTVSLLLNGTLAGSAMDAAYASGGLYIAAGNSDGGSDARLGQLVVTQPLPSTAEVAPPTAPTDDMRKAACHTDYYTQCDVVLGVVIKATTGVDPRAITQARSRVQDLVAFRTDIRQRMVNRNAALAIIPRDVYITQLPDYTVLKGGKTSDGRPYDAFLIRGVGGFLGNPVSSTSEENLLRTCCGVAGDRFQREDITYHEFGHAVMDLGFSRDELATWNAIYAQAHQAGRFAGVYADVNAHEYWAELTQAWFRSSFAGNAGVSNAAEIAAKDPAAYDVLDAVYGPPR
jgi:hypothetical protein